MVSLGVLQWWVLSGCQYSQVQVKSGNLIVARKPLTHRTIILGVQQKIKVYR